MEDLASEFQEDFMEAVKVLEDFSSSDGELKDAMREFRERIAARRYSCAPNFWDDLRRGLGAIERGREDGPAKSRAQQVLKQIARLEVKFWAKESIGMLREMDAESRLERMVDWLQTFDASDSGDQSSGPAVLFQVLNDLTLQKEMDQAQRDALAATVRENLGKFPFQMQAVLERVGSLQKRGPPVLGDWRRRSQAVAQDPPAAGGTGAAFLPAPAPRLVERPGFLGSLNVSILPATSASLAATSAAAAAEQGGDAGVPAPAAALPPWAEHGAASPPPAAAAEEEGQAEEDEPAGAEPFRIEDVSPELLARAQKATLALLESNSGECPKHFVRALLKQAGVPGMPIAALGESFFFSATEVFLRRGGAPAPEPGAPSRSGAPEELRQALVSLVREAGGRMQLAQLAEKTQWHTGSVRHSMYGPLRKAVATMPELVFEPKKVFTMEAAKHFIAAFAPAVEPLPEGAEEDSAAAAPQAYVGDAFAELLATARAWLHQAEGKLDDHALLKLSKAMGFRTRAVISALAGDIFWCHPEAEIEVLLRTAKGKQEHPQPLPDVYLHQQVHQALVAKVKELGTKAKSDKLAAALNWNAKSELKRTYGTVRVVLRGLRDVFFEPNKLFFKQSLDGIVEWPVGKNGRLGPRDDSGVTEHWTPAVDDQKLAGDPAWTAVKRQVLGTLMRNGGHAEAQVLRQLLLPLEDVELEALFEPGSDRDLSDLLFWGRDSVCCRRPQAVVPAEGEEVPQALRDALVSMVRAQGTALVADLRSALDTGGLLEDVDDAGFCGILQRVPELFFMPDRVFLRHVVETIIIEEATNPLVLEGTDDAVPVTALPAAPDAAGGAAPAPAEAPEPAAAAAAAAPAADAPAAVAEAGAAGAASEGGAGFFSFSGFAPGQEGPAADEASEGAKAEPAAKRPRLDASAAEQPWGDEAPPWACEGAAVVVRGADGGAPDAGGAIVQRCGATCVVRLARGGREVSVPTPMLLPVAPRVGATVRVIDGDWSGCTGELVGLAGAAGVVQIGKMSYQTLPMAQLAVLADAS